MTYIPELTLESGAIDTKSTGANSMGTTKRATKALAIQFEVLSDDTVSVGASISIGSNSTDYDDILPITALTTLLATGKFITITLASVLSVIPAGTEIFAKVTSAATGTTQTVKARLLGN